MKMNKSKEYILKVGKADAHRLDLLNKVYAPYTQSFLIKAGLKKNMTVLDVGCGTGNVSVWIAQQIGKKGKVIGVDSSQDQLKIAAQKAKSLGLNNIEFKHCSVYELSTLKMKFDFVFSRFLLIHLVKPEKGFANMLRMVKKGGILACDEQSTNAFYCHPPSQDFDKSHELSSKLTQLRGLNFNFGLQLYTLFKQFKLKNIHLDVIQPVLLSKKHKMLFPLFLQEIKAELLKRQLTTEAEFNQLMRAMLAIANNKNSYILPMRNCHVYGIK